MRTTYKNGAAVDLVENGCDGCAVTSINGHVVHEAGCPSAWKDRTRGCKNCGDPFYPSDVRETTCESCVADMMAAEEGIFADEEAADDCYDDSAGEDLVD